MRMRFENKGHGYKMRCSFCHRPKGELYKTRFDANSPTYLLCPGNCFKQAYTNYRDKTKKGITPIVEMPNTEPFTETMETSNDDGIDRD